MKQPDYGPSQFALASDDFLAALPVHPEISNDDLCKIKLPGWRYDQIMDSVLAMYDKTNARVMPLPVFDIAHSLNCSLIPYRTYGKTIYEALMSTSQDALVLQCLGSDRKIIMYNDRMLATRINFSIMHEIGHIMLGHNEHCPLAEKEAHYFAGVALCPVDLLEHYHITDSKAVCQLFNVSEEFSDNRLRTVRNRRGINFSAPCRRFAREVISRFKFEKAYQMDIFGSWAI